ncbi:MAG: hypothetical protein FJ405_18770, partial [Verrucomicrobia bacterium]|nr:hypothetical protein [Verrucomicrobiota bacterium]
MEALLQPKRVRVHFDESHSESWSICRARAKAISPSYPEYSSYQEAANLLTAREFDVHRVRSGQLTDPVLSQTDILVLVHPCDPKWERTLPGGSPRLSAEEIAAIHHFVELGGSLLVISEYEHDKYCDNLNELLAPYGIRFENGTVLDRVRCESSNPAWVLSEVCDNPIGQRIGRGTRDVCFYQTGWCAVQSRALPALTASAHATPSGACLVAACDTGAGRVVAVADSLLFGDDHIHRKHHEGLWLNLFYWLSVPAFRREGGGRPPAQSVGLPAWRELKEQVNALRSLQKPDGSVSVESHASAAALCGRIASSIERLAGFFTWQETYLARLTQDFADWSKQGFGKPDFHRSLESFEPQRNRRDGLEQLVVFPLYTPNASLDTRFEALVMRCPWPEWLAELERTLYRNEQFAPGHLEDSTDGYGSDCAVLFPETVSAGAKPGHSFATIFCNREARRLQDCARQCCELTGLVLPPEHEPLLHSLPLLEDTVALWDLIHDRSHSLGELPFDPFMIRQRAPFWMYAIEELRVDLRSLMEARKR